jgi:hypothetical protein
VKDKLFIFGNYEGVRDKLATRSRSTLPSPYLSEILLSACLTRSPNALPPVPAAR